MPDSVGWELDGLLVGGSDEGTDVEAAMVGPIEMNDMVVDAVGMALGDGTLVGGSDDGTEVEAAMVGPTEMNEIEVDAVGRGLVDGITVEVDKVGLSEGGIVLGSGVGRVVGSGLTDNGQTRATSRPLIGMTGRAVLPS